MSNANPNAPLSLPPMRLVEVSGKKTPTSMQLMLRALLCIGKEEPLLGGMMRQLDAEGSWFDLTYRFKLTPAGFEVLAEFNPPRIVAVKDATAETGPDAVVCIGENAPGRLLTPEEAAPGIEACKKTLRRLVSAAVMGLFCAAAEVLLERGHFGIGPDDLRAGLEGAIASVEKVGVA